MQAASPRTSVVTRSSLILTFWRDRLVYAGTSTSMIAWRGVFSAVATVTGMSDMVRANRSPATCS